ncbi:MAG: glycosyltransferase [Methylacidiphilales bacterium]|nr:glycosyltransferase [Candidatus Methylacidiphilales bacterium]NJR17749.1 glycosyltransferase [Calothrix sp. CSU_2_0]
MTNLSPTKLPRINTANISIIVPVYKGGSSFRSCLLSLSKCLPETIEIIVVVDGEDEQSNQIAGEFNVRVIKLAKNGGPARARNYGARAANGEILLFIDADVTVNTETLRLVIDAFASEPDIAAIIGSYDDTPFAPNFLSQYKNLFHHFNHQNGGTEAFTFWGACGAIRRDVFLSLGGFDESYRRPCIEDIEFGYRIKQAGYRIRLCKDVQVKHLKHWKLVSLLKAEIFDRAVPWTELILSNPKSNLQNDLNLGFLSRLSVMLVFALLACLLGVWWSKELVLLAAVFSLMLLAINYSVYLFFLKKRGFYFALGVIPWHWFYYLYGGIAFAIASSKFFLVRWFSTSSISEPGVFDYSVGSLQSQVDAPATRRVVVIPKSLQETTSLKLEEVSLKTDTPSISSSK